MQMILLGLLQDLDSVQGNARGRNIANHRFITHRGYRASRIMLEGNVLSLEVTLTSKCSVLLHEKTLCKITGIII